MFQGILSKVFKAREKVARDLTDYEKRRRQAENPDWDPDEQYDDEEKPFLEHLEDLRGMLLRIVATLLIAATVCFGFHRQLTNIVKRPLEQASLSSEYIGEDGRALPEVEPLSDPALPREMNERYRIGEIDPEADLVEGDLFYNRASRELKFFNSERWVSSSEKKKNTFTLTTTEVTGVFVMSIKVALFSAIVLSFPILLYFILQFVLPGLKRKEKRVLWPSLAVGFGLFLLGIIFSYYIVLPRALDFFHIWAVKSGVDTIWTIEKYVTFVTRFLLVFGLSFELPVLVMALVKIDILNYSIMKGTRRHAIVAILIFAAIVTPTTDPGTLMLLSVPMYILYEICIWIAFYMEKRDRELYPELYEAWDTTRDEDTDSDPWEWSEEDGDDSQREEDRGDPIAPKSASPVEFGGDDDVEQELTLDEIARQEEELYGHSYTPHPQYSEAQLMRKKKDDLIAIAESMGCPSYGTKKEITQMILDHL